MNYPDDVTGREPELHDDPSQEECACGHIMDEHEWPHGACQVEGCRCVYYEREGAY